MRHNKERELQMNLHFDTFGNYTKGKKVTKELSKTLKRYVETSPVSREEIRSAVGVDRSTMSRHLNGKIPLTYQKIQAYANVLGIQMYQLTGIEPMPIIGRTWKTEDRFRVAVYDYHTTKQKYIHPTVGYKKSYAAVIKEKDEFAPWLNGTVFIFDKDDMKKEVTQDQLEQWAFVKYVVDTEIRYKLAIVYSLGFRLGEKRKYEVYMPYGDKKPHENTAEVEFVCPIRHVVHGAESKHWTQSIEVDE